MIYRSAAILALALAGILAAHSSAAPPVPPPVQTGGHGHVQKGGQHGRHGGHYAQCPRCDYRCELKIDSTTSDKYCWKVQCVPVCIPRVTFPWEKCCNSCGSKECSGGKTCGVDGCPPKCAKMRYVNRLVKEEWECEKCRYKWVPVPINRAKAKISDAHADKQLRQPAVLAR